MRQKAPYFKFFHQNRAVFDCFANKKNWFMLFAEFLRQTSFWSFLATFWANVQFWCVCVPFQAQVLIKTLFTEPILPTRFFKRFVWTKYNIFVNIFTIDYVLVCLCALSGTGMQRKYFLWLFLPTIKNETFYLIWLNFKVPLWSKFWAFVKLWCVCVPCRAQR